MTYYDAALLKSNTPNGHDWLAKAIHPPSAKGQAYNGYPDKSVIPVVHAEYRLAYEGLPIAGVQGNNTNTILFLQSPGILNPIFHAEVLDGNNPEFTRTLANTQIDPNTVIQNFGKTRVAFQAETFQYDSSAFNENGMMYSAQFNPTTYIMTLGQGLATLRKQKSKHLPAMMKHFKQLYPHLHDHINQHGLGSDDDEFDVLTPRSLPISPQVFQVVKLDRPIIAPSDITMLSPKSYQSRSKEGGFVVHQVSQDTNAFKSVRVGRYSGGASVTPTNLMLCMYEYQDANTTYLEPFLPYTPMSNDFISDIEWSDWSWSYTMFTGCQPPATGVSPLNINIKFIQGIEIAPVPRSVLNSQTMPPALYDPIALDSYTIITQARQDCMPAAMNTLGSLASAASSILPSLVPSVVNAITNNAGPDTKKEVKADTATVLKEANVANNETTDVVANNAPPLRMMVKPNLGAIKRSGGRTNRTLNERFTRRKTPTRQNNSAIKREVRALRRQISQLSMGGNNRYRSQSRGSRPRSASAPKWTRPRSGSRKARR